MFNAKGIEKLQLIPDEGLIRRVGHTVDIVYERITGKQAILILGWFMCHK